MLNLLFRFLSGSSPSSDVSVVDVVAADADDGLEMSAIDETSIMVLRAFLCETVVTTSGVVPSVFFCSSTIKFMQPDCNIAQASQLLKI